MAPARKSTGSFHEYNEGMKTNKKEKSTDSFFTSYCKGKEPLLVDLVSTEVLRVHSIDLKESAYSSCLTIAFADTALDIFFPLGTIYVWKERPC